MLKQPFSKVDPFLRPMDFHLRILPPHSEVVKIQRVMSLLYFEIFHFALDFVQFHSDKYFLIISLGSFIRSAFFTS